MFGITAPIFRHEPPPPVPPPVPPPPPSPDFIAGWNAALRAALNLTEGMGHEARYGLACLYRHYEPSAKETFVAQEVGSL